MLEPILRAAWDGLWLVFSWPNILYPVAATLVAMVVAFLPGISGITVMALAIPLTFTMDPLHTLLIFGALVGGATFMGSVTAILFNVPGSGPSAATLIDGHPLARLGQARTAIGSSAAASALGSTFGVAVLVLFIPMMRQAVLFFGAPEFLMLTIWGLTTVAVVARGSLHKGLATAGVGFVLAFVGHDPRTGELRYTFGSLYLWDGVALVPALLGLFSIAETIDLSVSGRRTISGTTNAAELGGSVAAGVRAVFSHLGLLIRSSIVGTVVGVIPGVGGTVASFVAYGQAVQTSRDRSRFGHGDIRGVIAPEAAHDAKDGASLIPTLTFGIPGNEGTALLLAAMILHGLPPGRELMASHLDLVFALIWSLFLSNWLTSLIGLAVVSPLARLTALRTQVLSPIILVTAVVGAFAYRGRVADIVLAVGFGVAGYLMKKHEWPRMPLVIALLLGGLFERSLYVTMRLQEIGRISFWTRPAVVVLVALIVFNLVLPYRGRSRPLEAPVSR